MNTAFFSKVSFFLTSLLIASSLFAMFEWVSRMRIFFTLNNEGATMKFNTALLFLLSILTLLISKKKENLYQVLYYLFAIVTLVISSLIVLDYAFDLQLKSIDELFVKDTISKKLPGRMSAATALCFSLFSIGLLSLKIKSEGKIFVFITQFISLAIIMAGFLSLVTEVLDISVEQKSLFNTMSVQTSFSFIFISFVLLDKTPFIGLKETLYGENYGSVLLRQMLPFFLIIPIILGYVMILLIKDGTFNESFGIILHTVILIFVSFVYLYIISNNLNKTNEVNKDLVDNLLQKNEEFKKMKKK